ncbi:MAG: SIMPL domain-containing protein [Caldimonas sp.]
MNYCRCALAAALAGAAALTCPPAVAEGPAPVGVLSLAASASVEVTKDLLAVTFSTTREGADANAVQAQLKAALDTALAEAKKVARPGQLDVQTGNFSLYPRYATPVSGKPSLNGWTGTAELVVEGHDMAAIGQLSGRITTMTIGRVAYRLSREASAKVEDEIVAEAIARYRVKAADYSKRFGYDGYVVREVNVSTSEPGGPMPMQRMAPAAMSAGSALSVEPGKAVVTATVNGSVQMQ